MAEPTTDVPEAALNVDPERPQEGEAALRAVLETYGGDYADAAEYTEELENVLETAILVVASADDDEVDDVTESVVALVRAADALSTEGTVALAEGVGEHGDDLADALDSVLELQAEGNLDGLVELAAVVSALEIDDADVESLNRLIAAAGEAESTAEPVGPLQLLRSLGRADVRAGLGYLLAVVRALGRGLGSRPRD